MTRGDSPATAIFLGVSADLRNLYDVETPGREHLGAKPTYMNEYVRNHIVQDHPERLEWVESSTGLIAEAVRKPIIVYRGLVYKDQIGHWSQAYVAKNPTDEGQLVTVVLSLAAIEGEESEIHQVITVYPSKHRDFYRGNPGEIKERWLEVTQ